MKKILIVVDMQNDFIDGVLGTKEAQSIVDNVCEKIKNTDKETAIICTRDTHFEDYLSTEEGKNLPVKHCICDTEGWKVNTSILDVLKGHSVSFVDKYTFGAAKLSEDLRFASSFLVRSIDEIELVGLCTDICVISNAVIAKSTVPNAHIVVDAACCAGVTPESHDTAIKAMKTLQIEIKNENKEPWRK